MNDQTVDPLTDTGPPAGFDTTLRYVRITGERPDGFVEFDFAIGEPEVFVELVLSRDAFEEFRRENKATLLPSEPHDGVPDTEPDAATWRLGDVTRRHL